MKICPFCTEEIQDNAIKCDHCGEFLDPAKAPRDETEKMRWYFRKSFIVFAVACVGPMALPLIWWRPETSRGWKLGLTIAILILSWVLFEMTMESVRMLREYYKLIEQL